MKKIAFLIVTALSVLLNAAHARDDKLMLPIKEAKALGMEKEKLDPNIPLYFGTTAHPAVQKKFGTFVSNKKTNAVGKSDEYACQWVFLSAAIALQERAKAEGGNAVINIKSYYKKNEFSSNTEFECHAGNIMAGVALRGTVVKIAR